MKKTTRILILFSALFLVICCNKKFDEPIIISAPLGTVISIDTLKNILYKNGVGTPACDSSIRLLIDTSYSITGVITTEETNGALYKEAYMQDQSGAIKLKLLNAGGLYKGDSIRIYLKDLTIERPSNTYCSADYNIQLNDVDVNQHISKISTENFVKPYVITIDQIINDIENKIYDDQCKVIKLENVEFISTSSTYADAIGLTTVSNSLVDCDGETIVVRTSGYANFAADSLACGNGSITGIMTRYGDIPQFLIRDINEVLLDSIRCDGSYCGGSGGGGSVGDILFKDFEDGSMTSGGWKNFWSGTNPNIGEWELYTTFGNGPVAKASNYSNSTNYACESWLVSPLFDLTIASSPYLVFDNVTRYSGDDLELYISSNYDGVSNPDQSGTWTNLTSYVPNWDTDDFSWDLVSSGNTDLTPFISSSVAIAFKYSGSDSNGATWEVDNILITE